MLAPGHVRLRHRVRLSHRQHAADAEKGAHGEVVVPGEEDVRLPRLHRTEPAQEVQHALGVWPAVHVVAQEDHLGGGKLRGPDLRLQPCPQRLQLLKLAVDVADQDEARWHCHGHARAHALR